MARGKQVHAEQLKQRFSNEDPFAELNKGIARAEVWEDVAKKYSELEIAQRHLVIMLIALHNISARAVAREANINALAFHHWINKSKTSSLSARDITKVVFVLRAHTYGEIVIK